MDDLEFEWDDRKNASNQRKHGVTFEEAATAFSDQWALVLDDVEHSSEREDRFVLLGMSAALRLLVICHCYRANDQIIRIISARKATSRERQQYFERWNT